MAFYIDVISTFPFELFKSDVQNNNIKIFQLLKIIRLFRIKKILNNIFSKITKDQVKHSTEILKNILSFLLTLHWFTCLYFGFT